MHMRQYKIMVLLLVALAFGSLSIQGASPEDPMVMIRDLTRIDGIRENYLSGIGLVVGLNGTGDTRFAPTAEMLQNYLKSFGIAADASQLKAKNVAVVEITATLPPYARSGDRVDVTVKSIGDAKSLFGGYLTLTALYAPNREIYAGVQGAISVGGFSGGSGGTSTQQNHLQVGRIPNGAILEKSLEVDLSGRTELDFLLNDWNFETASLVAQAINERFSQETGIASPVNAGRVKVQIPATFRSNIVDFIAQVNGLQVRASMPAKIVINERTGTIVMGHDVRISTVAVAHGNLTVTISTQEKTTENKDEDGNTETITETTVQLNVTEEKKQLIELKTGPTVSDVVSALNAIGASPRDIIAILQAMKEAGALYAQLELM